MGAELGEHKRGHNYEVIYRCGPPVFETAPDEGPQWGILEEQRLLSLIRAYKVEDWLVYFYSIYAVKNFGF